MAKLPNQLEIAELPTMKLIESDPGKLFKLYGSLHDQSGNMIQIKINRYLEAATGSFISFIVFLLENSEEAVIQVIGEDVLHEEVRFPMHSTNVLQCAINDRRAVLTKASRLDADLAELLGRKAQKNGRPRPEDRFLNVPIQHPASQRIVLLVGLINFSQELPNPVMRCERIVTECLRYCLGTVLNTMAFEEQKRFHLQCQTLLIGARNLFSHLGDVSDLMREIMAEARILTKAERCSLFLLEDNGDLVSKVFDGVISSEMPSEVRIEKGQGIAGHVALTGELLNIKDAYAHPLFYKDVDVQTGFKTRNILCFPIVDEKSVIGVAELCNKQDGFSFSHYDEHIAMAFSIYCGLSILHSLVYKKIQAAQARNKLANELMIYHMKVEEEAVQRLVNCDEEHCYPDLELFSFCPRTVTTEDSTCLIYLFFSDLGLVNHYNIDKEALARFILYVQRGYRQMAYHNWEHAFAVSHYAYLVLKNLKLMKIGYFTPLEGMAYLVASLCHDVDHRGTTNQFQLKAGTTLADLYSSEGSVMERHHLSQTMCILNTPGCNFIENLEEARYKQFIDLISQMILATDLANHFRLMDDFKEMAEVGFDVHNQQHKLYLQSMLMTCADLSDQTKDWHMCRVVAEMIYNEFFSQGDQEKAMGTKPIEMMDREKAKIPELQIQFLTDVCQPLLKILADMFPEMQECLNCVNFNIRCWQKSIVIFDERAESGLSSIDVLGDDSIEDEVLNSVMEDIMREEAERLAAEAELLAAEAELRAAEAELEGVNEEPITSQSELVDHELDKTPESAE